MLDPLNALAFALFRYPFASAVPRKGDGRTFSNDVELIPEFSATQTPPVESPRSFRITDQLEVDREAAGRYHGTSFQPVSRFLLTYSRQTGEVPEKTGDATSEV